MPKTPYPISWQNRFFNALNRIPLPNVITYLLFILIAAFGVYPLLWMIGSLPFGDIGRDALQYSFWLLFGLVAWRLVDGASIKALREFRPALPVSDAKYAALEHRFLYLSAAMGWVMTLMSVLFTALGTFLFPTLVIYVLPSDAATIIANSIFLTLMWSLVGAFFATVVNRLRLIRDFYAMVKDVDLFNQGRLTALSTLTMRMSLVFVFGNLVSYLFNIALEDERNIAAAVFFLIVNTIMAIGTFTIPLVRFHLRLVEEKKRMKALNSENITLTYKRLYEQVRSNKLQDAEKIRHSLASLMDVGQLIEKAPTWPWETRTLRDFVSALTLPLLLWLIQGVLSRFVSF